MWYFIVLGLFIVLSFVFYSRRQPKKDRNEIPEVNFEAGEELGISPQDDLGIRDMPEKDLGSLRDRPIRKDSLSKEAELVLDAEGASRYQKGAWAYERDIDKDFYEKENYSLPEDYNKDRLVLLPKDPNSVYAYWEVTHEKYREMYQKHLAEWGLSKPLLRLYDMTDRGEKPKDIFLQEAARDYYIEIPHPNHQYIAEVGRFFEPDLFVPLVVSNKVGFRGGDYYGCESSPLFWGNDGG